MKKMIKAATKTTESVKWGYFKKFESVNKQYVPESGEGHSLATQAATAINKLIYKWYNDGDVFDNTHYLSGWANDLSSYANWLDKYIDGAGNILGKIAIAKTGAEYSQLLKELADKYLTDSRLGELSNEPAEGSVYDCSGPFRFDGGDDW